MNGLNTLWNKNFRRIKLQGQGPRVVQTHEMSVKRRFIKENKERKSDFSILALVYLLLTCVVHTDDRRTSTAPSHIDKCPPLPYREGVQLNVTTEFPGTSTHQRSRTSFEASHRHPTPRTCGGCTPGVCLGHLSVLQNGTEPQVHLSAISLLFSTSPSCPPEGQSPGVPQGRRRRLGRPRGRRLAWGGQEGESPQKLGCLSDVSPPLYSGYLLWSSSSLSQLGSGWPILYSSLESSMLCSW